MTTNTIIKELKEIKRRLERIEAILEENLIETDKPTKDEEEAIKEYEKSKKEGKITLTPLNKITTEKID